MVENQYIIDISTNADPTPIEELGDKIQTVVEAANELNDTPINIDADGTGLDDVAQSSEGVADGLDSASNSAGNLKDELSGIDSSTLQETANNANEASDSIDNVSDSISVAGAGAGALAGVGIGAFFLEAAESAGTASDSLTAIDLNLQKAGASASMIRNIDTNISAAANETGRSAGKVRTAFQSWTAAGVTTGSTMERLFEIGSATAFTNPRVSLEGFTSALQMSIQRGTLNDRILQNMGTSMDQLTQKTGYTKEELNDMYAAMTPDERASFLAQYAGDMEAVKKANTDFKTSWEGTKEAISKSVGGMIRSIGDVMLPSLVPALQLAADVLSKFTDGFKWLNTVTGGAAGWFVGIVGGIFAFTSLAPGVKLVFDNFKNGIDIITGLPKTVSNAFSSINTAINGQGPGVNSLRYRFMNLKTSAHNMSMGIKSSFDGVASKISTFASTAGGKLKSAGSALLQYGKDALTAGKNALLGAGRFIIASAQRAAAWIAETAPKVAATISNWALAASEYALLLPILLVVAAIIAVVAVLWYLYNNNETVRAGIDWLIASFWNFVGMLGQIPAAIQGFVSSGIAWISQLPGRIWMYLIAIIARVMAWGSNLINQGRATATKFVGTVVSFFTSLPGKIYNAIKGVVDYFRKVFTDAGMAAYNAMLATPILGDLIRAGGDAISWIMKGGNTAGGDTGGGYAAGGDFTTASTGYKPPNLDRNINQSSNNGNTYNYYNTNDLKGIIDKDAAEYIIDTITKKTREDLLKIGKAV